MDNGTLELIDEALKSDETPRWGKALLIAVRDDHARLMAHLAEHERWGAPARQVATAVLTAVALAVAWWLLSGGAAGLVR